LEQSTNNTMNVYLSCTQYHREYCTPIGMLVANCMTVIALFIDQHAKDTGY